MDSNGKRILACLRCSDKRVKCDRKSPCAACIKHKSPCMYRGRKVRAKRESITTKQHIELDNRRTPLSPTDTVDSSYERSVAFGRGTAAGETAPETTIFKPVLIQGQESSKLIANNLWSRVAEEAPDEDDGADDPLQPLAEERPSNDQDFLHTLGMLPSSEAPQHPNPTQVQRLWQIFRENVDPLLKILHIPTFQYGVDKAVAGPDQLPRGCHALMFAIYSIAVVSITDEECKAIMGQSRSTTLAYLTSSTKLALNRARFMSSTNLVVMQALTYHIMSIRHTEEPRAVWNLTGMALRLAQGMGLGIDGSLLGLSPFHTELRRRLWWQLKMHDFQAAELCGQSKFQQFVLDETTPKTPANVNDSDLYPSMKEPPIESERPTEMIWSVVRTQLATFASRQAARTSAVRGSSLLDGVQLDDYTVFEDLAAKDAVCKEMEDLVETKFLRFCDPCKPLQLMVSLAGRIAIDHVRFISHHPRRWVHQKHVSATEKNLVWNSCLNIVDRTVLMQTMPQLQRYSWIVPYFIGWSAIIHILDTLRLDPFCAGSEKAWELIYTIYNVNTEMLLSRGRPIFVAVGSLYLKAHHARLKAAVSQGRGEIETPDFLLKLEKLQQEAKERRIKRQAKIKKINEIMLAKELLEETSTSGQDPSGQQACYHTPDSMDDQDFWLNAAASVSVTTAPTSVSFDMVGDMDDIFSSNAGFQSTEEMLIDWNQWDAWLSNSRIPS